MPPAAPTWELNRTYDHCARHPQAFEDWNRVFTSWKHRVQNYVPKREAALILHGAIKGQDARRELRVLPMNEIMSDTGLDQIHGLLENAFQEQKNTTIQAAMRIYESVHRDTQDGVRVYASKFREAERITTDAGLEPYEGEARGSKFLTGARLLASDARNVLVHTQGSWDLDELRVAMETLWPTKAALV